MASFPTLTSLTLSLEAPSLKWNISALTQLKYLDMMYAGGVPSSCLVDLSSLTQLETLRLRCEDLETKHLPLLGKLTHLNTLHFYKTPLRDDDLQHLKDMKLT